MADIAGEPLKAPDECADGCSSVVGFTAPAYLFTKTDALEFVEAVVTGQTKEWLTKHGLLADKMTPANYIAIAKAICAVIGPVCQFINSL